MSSTRQSDTICRWEPTELASTILSASARQVIRAWISSKEFLDEHNDPVMLMMDTQSANSFAQLVQSTSPELAPLVVLNELLRKGVVEPLDNGSLLLRRSVYAPSQPRRHRAHRINRIFRADEAIARRRFNDTY
ncbi:hypothetical protein [Marinobacter sp. 1_MG-2023]|uniref:hypothetical protein n=1 Tax=Marinobacter sp. 1_MG-2023 TaxID=3062627 RepID=UPI0026E192A8|nr:hypothetical protein [Marinobacter sp. 1_MG-2023]MDO6823005.1 hypothetical protein [Marinobacter sp. 1_MG-2023]